MHEGMYLFLCLKAANMTWKQSVLRIARLWLNKNNSSFFSKCFPTGPELLT